MVEWQTRRTQNPVGVTPWGFKSPLRHHTFEYIGSFDPLDWRETSPKANEQLKFNCRQRMTPRKRFGNGIRKSSRISIAEVTTVSVSLKFSNFAKSAMKLFHLVNIVPWFLFSFDGDGVLAQEQV